MIHREATIKYKGYNPDDLKPHSMKRICMVCDGCDRVRWGPKEAYRDLCHKCACKKYLKDPNWQESMKVAGKKRSESKEWQELMKKVGKNRSKNEKWQEAIRKVYEDPNFGKHISATKQGISYDECRESNREKYNRKCFLTGLPESKNITKTGKLRKLSVHHYDMDKSQGCNDVKWKLVPICLEWHNKVHTKLWEARITWLLENVYR